MNKIVLVVAGGSGTRMKSEVPKQFLILNDKPVIMYTLEVFHHYDKNMRIILVLPDDQTETWRILCKKYQFVVPHDIRTGGETRFHSVKNNLHDIPDNSLVAVHDGVRPLVTPDTIERCFVTAGKFGNAVPSVSIPETLRKAGHRGSRQVNRTDYRLIQTPQVFRGAILKEAYTQKYSKYFTDDAGVVEKIGYTIQLVEGNFENIKITYERDLIIAAALIKSINK